MVIQHVDDSECKEIPFQTCVIFREKVTSRDSIPADTIRNNDVVITSKQRNFVKMTSFWRHNDVIINSLRHVFVGWFKLTWYYTHLTNVCWWRRYWKHRMTGLLWGFDDFFVAKKKFELSMI